MNSKGGIQGAYTNLNIGKTKPVLTVSRLEKIISMIETTIKWPLVSGTPLPRWTTGRLVILGDAAHAMLPYMSQGTRHPLPSPTPITIILITNKTGAAMAVEDGLALSRTLTKLSHITHLPHALQIFEKVRIPRATKMQEASLLNGKLWHFPDGPLQQARDKAMRPETVGEVGSHSPNQWSDPATQMWAYGYDAEGEVDRVWGEERASVRSQL